MQFITGLVDMGFIYLVLLLLVFWAAFYIQSKIDDNKELGWIQVPMLLSAIGLGLFFMVHMFRSWNIAYDDYLKERTRLEQLEKAATPK